MSLSLTNVLQFRSGLGELFLLRLGDLASVGLVGFASLAAASNLLPTTGVIHGGRRHVLVGFFGSQVVALSTFNLHFSQAAKSDVFMFPVTAVKVRGGFRGANLRISLTCFLCRSHKN